MFCLVTVKSFIHLPTGRGQTHRSSPMSMPLPGSTANPDNSKKHQWRLGACRFAILLYNHPNRHLGPSLLALCCCKEYPQQRSSNRPLCPQAQTSRRIPPSSLSALPGPYHIKPLTAIAFINFDAAMLTLNPKDLSVQILQKYLQNAIAPRPICFASTISAAGEVNGAVQFL